MQPVPEYMDQGSHGPDVTILHAFLIGAGYGERIVIDLDYGEETAKAVNSLQVDRGIDADGNFGPKTRAMVKSDYSFDFAAACISIPGTTVFKHGDEEVEWTSPASVENAHPVVEKAPEPCSCRLGAD